MVKLLALLSSVCACFGQAFTLQDTAFLGNVIPKVSGAALSPTNLPSAVSISWWKAADYYTNSGVPTIPDSGPGNYSITNRDGDYNWPHKEGTLNGIPLVKFVFDQAYLKSTTYTSSQPHTVCLVMYLNDGDNVAKYIFDSANCSTRNAFYEVGPGLNPKRVALNSGGEIYGYINTNTWSLVECLFSGASSQMWTNGVSCGAASDAGTSSCDGFNLCASCNSGNQAGYLLAEAMTYSTAFTAADRNYISNYVRGKYGAGNVVP